MAWFPTIYSLLGFGATGVSALVAGQVWRNRTQRGARPFIWLMLALGGWSLVYGIQLGFTTLSSQLLWQRVSLAIGGTIPTLWLVFTLHYLRRDHWLTQRRRAVLAIDPILFALLTLTNPVHGVIWNSGTLTSTQAGPVLNLSLALGYYIHIGYAYLIITLGLGLFLRMFERTTPIYWRQIGFLILGVLPPFVGNIAYTFRVSWGLLPAIDPTPFLFVLPGVLWALALYQFDLLNRIPLARQHIIDEMGDGFVVLDTGGQIVEATPTAKHALDPSPEVGRSITELISEETETINAARETLDGRTITATVNSRERAYDLKLSSLTDEQGTVVGHVIAFRDVTDRHGYEQRLEVAQRMLRHNLRNDMNVIQGWADQLVERATNGQATTARRISETADELIDLSEKTHAMVQLEAPPSTERTVIDVQEHLPPLVEDFSDAHPEVTIECAVPDSIETRLPDEDFLLIPIENLIENAIEHNDADDQWVRVHAEAAGEQVRIHVEDNGPPIPEMERSVLEEGTEDSLHHGTGLGFWLTYWGVKPVGGDMKFDNRDPRGNIVTLEFPTVKQPVS